MRTSLDNQRAMGCFLERPFCLTALADALIQVGSIPEAITLCDEALELANRTEGRSYEAETRRVRGEATLATGGEDAAERAKAEFRSALDCALSAGCKLLALRAAISLSGLAVRTGRTLSGRATLAEIVGSFRAETDFATLATAARMRCWCASRPEARLAGENVKRRHWCRLPVGSVQCRIAPASP